MLPEQRAAVSVAGVGDEGPDRPARDVDYSPAPYALM